MKKRYIFMLVLITCVTVSPMFVLARGKAANVAEALELEDGSKVHLEGYIVEMLRETFYLFRDDTGDIELEIADDVWGDRELMVDEKVRIHGKIDRDDDAATIFIKVKKIKDMKDKDVDDDDVEIPVEDYDIVD